MRRYNEEPERWHDAARRVLADHPADKVLEAIAYLEFDQVIGTKVRSMPDLERHIEDLRHRAHVARRQTGSSAERDESTAPTWADAFAQITEAIRRHGASGSVAARSELTAVHQAYGLFIDRVGWTSLCREDPQRRQWDWQQAWRQTCHAPTATDSNQEAAA